MIIEIVRGFCAIVALRTTVDNMYSLLVTCGLIVQGMEFSAEAELQFQSVFLAKLIGEMQFRFGFHPTQLECLGFKLCWLATYVISSVRR